MSPIRDDKNAINIQKLFRNSDWNTVTPEISSENFSWYL